MLVYHVEINNFKITARENISGKVTRNHVPIFFEVPDFRCLRLQELHIKNYKI
jgi:hypothetical protein